MVSTCKEKHHNINVLVWRQVQYVGKLQISICCPWLKDFASLSSTTIIICNSSAADLQKVMVEICTFAAQQKAPKKGNKMKHNEINGTYIGKRGKTRWMPDRSKLDWSLSSVNNNEKYEKVFFHQETILLSNIEVWGTSILSFNLSTSEIRDLRSTKSCKGN